jgi:hypothetical protein
VVWDDLFKVPAQEELERRDVRGLSVPDSNFLEDPQLATRQRLAPVWRRIKGATIGPPPGALRGNGLISVTALPENEELSDDQLNQVTQSPDLAFRVVVENSGEVEEVQVPVTLTIQQTPTPIRKRLVIERITPGQQQSVVFRDIPEVDIAEETTLQVAVEPIEDEEGNVVEERTDNNSADYPVIFGVPE